MPILLIEDDPVDARAIQQALGDSHAADAVSHVSCVREALACLRSAKSPKPALILLNLRMPDIDGLEFLGTIKSDPRLAAIPVVVLTASQEPQDVLNSFEFGIAGYMVKSADYTGLLETVRTIQTYWSLSRFPSHQAG